MLATSSAAVEKERHLRTSQDSAWGRANRQLSLSSLVSSDVAGMHPSSTHLEVLESVERPALALFVMSKVAATLHRADAFSNSDGKAKRQVDGPNTRKDFRIIVQIGGGSAPGDI